MLNNFKVENTAISTKNSRSAEILVKDFFVRGSKILDYGCGTGRNIAYMLEKLDYCTIDGTDIKAQLDKETLRLNKLRENGCKIELPENLKNNYYDIILNSHVLNVIAEDETKLFVLSDIYKKLRNGGVALVEVRSKKDIEASKTKVPYGEGYKIKKGNSYTYQEAISKEKLTSLATTVGFKVLKNRTMWNSSRHILVLLKEA